MLNISSLLRLQTKSSLFILTTILISLSISASTANNAYFPHIKDIAEANSEYQFSNGGSSKKFTPPSYLNNKGSNLNKFTLRNDILVSNVVDLLDTKKLLWQKGENINFQQVFGNKSVTPTVNNQLTAVEVAPARLDKVSSDFVFPEKSILDFDEVSRRPRFASTAASRSSEKLPVNETNQIINPIFFTFPVFPSFLCQSGFYVHEKYCNDVKQSTELDWIDESIVSLSPLVIEKSNDWLTNPETDDLPNLVNTPIVLETEEDLTKPEVIGFVPDKPEVANTLPKGDASKPEVADKTEFNKDDTPVSDSASTPESDTSTGSTEIVNSNPTKVPEPGTISLFSFGLIGTVIRRYRHPNF